MLFLEGVSRSLSLVPDSLQLEAVHQDELSDAKIDPFREAEDEVSRGVNWLPIATNRHLGIEATLTSSDKL